MIFNSHSDLAGMHAFLSASKYHWINYDSAKLTEVWTNAQAARRGTELHAFAHRAVQLGIKLPRSSKTLNMYVNDAIGYRMSVEQVLFYSPNCYGTADTIVCTRDVLRIHDLKTGVIPGSMHQLEIYAALFCLEYAVKPGELQIELRIYQNDAVESQEPDIDTIAHIMSKIIVFDQHIENLKVGG
jgi:RecB family exonuclease